LHRAGLPQRIQHLLHKAGLHGSRVFAEFVDGVQQPAVLGNAGGVHRRRAQLVAQHAHHLVVHLQQGFAQQRAAGFA